MPLPHCLKQRSKTSLLTVRAWDVQSIVVRVFTVGSGVVGRAATAVVAWGEAGFSQLDAALTRNGYERLSAVIGSDVFHSGGVSTAVPFLHTIAHCCRVWHCPYAIVVSSFRSSDTTATVEATCAAVGLRRVVVEDGLCDEDADRLPQHRCLVEHLYVYSGALFAIPLAWADVVSSPVCQREG
jgi:hypothetical protein